MSDFTKPTRKIIPASEVTEYLNGILKNGLEKDLHDEDNYTEEICETCHGTGLALFDMPYGLKDDPDKHSGTLFPYRNQSINFCTKCSFGIAKRCNFCGKLIPRGMLKCSCEKQKEIDRVETERKEKEAIDKAPVLSDEMAERESMFYSDRYSENNGYFEDFEDFFEDWECNHKPEDERPEYVWVADEIRMYIDAEDIVERACEDLDEDAYDRVSGAIPAMQDYLDDWINNNGTSCYVESHRAKVRIPWERYKREEA